MRRVPPTLIIGLLLLALVPQDVGAQTTRPGRAREARAARETSKFLRFVPVDEGGRLETSIVSYRNADGVTVDLIGAVHIGDAEYYARLNERFEDYDAVLFEMVRPRDALPAAAGATQPARPGATTTPGARRRGGNLRWVGTLQRFMRDHLELEHQLEAIDYERANFVHADLDTETFFEMQEARGESFFTMMLQVMMRELGKGPGAGASGAAQPTVFELLAALQAPDRARQLKLVLARQMEQMDDLLAGIEGPEGSVIISERNKAAMRVLRDRIELGDDRIAIFYGAGHFKGMEEILTREMDFEQVGQPEWLTAWDLTVPSAMTTRPTTVPTP